MHSITGATWGDFAARNGTDLRTSAPAHGRHIVPIPVLADVDTLNVPGFLVVTSQPNAGNLLRQIAQHPQECWLHLSH